MMVFVNTVVKLNSTVVGMRSHLGALAKFISFSRRYAIDMTEDCLYVAAEAVPDRLCRMCIERSV